MQLVRGGRDTAVETRYCSALQAAGREEAAKVQPGNMVGSECTNEGEPCIVSLALSGEKVWEGPPDKSWMGKIEAGEFTKL